MADDQVWVSRPDVENPGLVPADSVPVLWGPKGWSLVEFDLDKLTKIHGYPINDPMTLTVEQVRDYVKTQKDAADAADAEKPAKVEKPAKADKPAAAEKGSD